MESDVSLISYLPKTNIVQVLNKINMVDVPCLYVAKEAIPSVLGGFSLL